MKLNETQIKIILLDDLLQKYNKNEILIANEFPYLTGRRRLDLLMIRNNKIHAFEIKSDLDSLQRLENQLSDYLDTFDYTYIVTTTRYEYEILQKVNKSIGIIIVYNKTNIRTIREPIIRKRFKKINIAQFLWRKEVIQQLSNYKIKFNRNDDTYALQRKLNSAININKLKKIATDTIVNRIIGKYKNFLSERSELTDIEDLINLTSADKELVKLS